MATTTKKQNLADQVDGIARQASIIVAVASGVAAAFGIGFEHREIATTGMFFFGISMFTLGWLLAQKCARRKVTTITQGQARTRRRAR